MSKKILFLFTATYPYGEGESFIETEISYLSACFDSIIIITNCITGFKRELPQNVFIEYLPYDLSFFDKIKALKGLYNSIYKSEKACVKSIYKLPINKSIRNIALTSIYKAKKINDFIKKKRLKYCERNDKVILYSYWMNDMAAGCAYAKSKDNTMHFITRAHGWDVYFERHNPPYLPLRNYIAQHADCISFISKQGLDYFVKKNIIKEKENLKISYLGTKQRHQKQYHRTDKIFKIVSCSSIIPLKQIDKLAEALSLLENNYLIEWTHIGGGREHQSLENKIRLLLREKENIKWAITGILQNKEVLQFYDNNRVDLFLNTSQFEGLPVSIMEAFSYGIPALAPDIGGISEIIDSDENGVLFSFDASPKEIADCLRKMIDMPENEYLKFRESAYKKWHSHFDADNNYKKFIENFVQVHKKRV